MQSLMGGCRQWRAVLHQRAAHSLATWDSVNSEVDQPLPANLPLLASEGRTMVAPGMLAALAGCTIRRWNEGGRGIISLAWLPPQIEGLKIDLIDYNYVLAWDTCPRLSSLRVFLARIQQRRSLPDSFCEVFPNLERVDIALGDVVDCEAIPILLQDLGSIESIREVVLGMEGDLEVGDPEHSSRASTIPEFCGPSECRLSVLANQFEIPVIPPGLAKHLQRFTLWMGSFDDAFGRVSLNLTLFEHCNVLESVCIDAGDSTQPIEVLGLDRLPLSCKSVVLSPHEGCGGPGQFLVQAAFGWQIRHQSVPRVVQGETLELDGNELEFFRA